MFPYIGKLPSYGLMIIVALVLVNLIAYIICIRRGLIFYDYILIECYAGLGAIIGSKALYLFTIYDQIEWKLFFSRIEYFSSFMRGGFVFWGGLLLAIPFVLIGAKIHKIKIKDFLNLVSFVAPIGHGIGRIGCFMAGCCYGIRTNSFISVIYPEGSFAPAGVKIFPVQLLEALTLLVISVFVYILFLKEDKDGGIYFYLITYSITRFVLEFFRGDSYRGIFLGFSTSQWICALTFCTTFLFFLQQTVKQEAESLTK